jgi:hypothetical protein
MKIANVYLTRFLEFSYGILEPPLEEKMLVNRMRECGTPQGSRKESTK